MLLVPKATIHRYFRAIYTYWIWKSINWYQLIIRTFRYLAVSFLCLGSHYLCRDTSNTSGCELIPLLMSNQLDDLLPLIIEHSFRATPQFLFSRYFLRVVWATITALFFACKKLVFCSELFVVSVLDQSCTLCTFLRCVPIRLDFEAKSSVSSWVVTNKCLFSNDTSPFNTI